MIITTKEFGWDDYKGFVIRAKTEQEARNLAVEVGQYSNGSVFLDSQKSKCKEIKKQGTAEIILESFNAG